MFLAVSAAANPLSAIFTFCAVSFGKLSVMTFAKVSIGTPMAFANAPIMQMLRMTSWAFSSLTIVPMGRPIMRICPERTGALTASLS